MKKRWLSLLLITCLILTLLPLNTWALDESKINWLGNSQDYQDIILEKYGTSGLMPVTVNGKMGAVDLTGNLVVPNIYDVVEEFNTLGYAKVKLNGNYGVVNSQGKEVVPPHYGNFMEFSQDGTMITVSSPGSENKLGYYNSQGVKITDLIYQKNYSAGHIFIDGYARVFLQSGEVRFINAAGNEVAEAQVSMKTRGLVNFKGSFVPPIVFDQTDGWSVLDQESLQYLPAENAFLLLDKTNGIHLHVEDAGGKRLTKDYNYYIGELFHNRRIVANDGVSITEQNPFGIAYGAVDAAGNEVIPLIYSDLTNFNQNGLAWAQKGSKWGLIDQNGGVVIDFIYDNVITDAIEGFHEISAWNIADEIPGSSSQTRYFQENRSWVNDGMAETNYHTNKRDINYVGGPIIARQTPPTGISIVVLNGKYGYINPDGSLLVAPSYDYAKTFDNGYAEVRRGDRYGIIDINGKEIFMDATESMTDTTDCLALFIYGVQRVKLSGGVYNIIDKNGNFLLSKHVPHIGRFYKGFASVSGAAPYIIDARGRTAIPYGFMPKTSDPFILIVKDGKIGVTAEANLGFASATPAHTNTEPKLELTRLPVTEYFMTGNHTFDTTGFAAQYWNSDGSITSLSAEDVEFTANGQPIHDGYVFQSEGIKTGEISYNGLTKTFRIFVYTGSPTPESVPGATGQELEDGDYYISCLGNFLHIKETRGRGYLILQNTSPYDIFTVENQGDYYYLKASNGLYISINGPEAVGQGDQLMTATDPFKWTITHLGDDSYSIRSYERQGMVVNASGEKKDNGTPIIVWLNTKTPKNAKLTFKPAN